MFAAAVVLAAGGSVALIAPTPVSAEINYGDVLVDDVGGHVFVTYGDGVRVFDLEGALVKTIPDQLGAVDLLLHGRTVYVLAAGATRINAIDADALTMTTGWSLGSLSNVSSIAWSTGRVWFSYGGSAAGGIGRLDPVTGSVVAQKASGLYSAGDIAATESPARVYVLDKGMSPSKIWKYDITTDPPTFLTSSPHSNACSNGRELAVSPVSSMAWTACGSPYKFNEFDTAILGEPANNYASTNYPNAIGVSADGKFLVGGTDSIYGTDVWFYEVGTYSPVRSWELGGDVTVVPGMVAVSNNGVHAYAVSTDGVLHTWTQAPRIASISPNHIEEGTSAQITVTGTGLAAVTSATIGGSSVSASVLSDTQLKLTVPANLTAGQKAVVLTSAWGTNLVGGAAVITIDQATPDAPAAPVITGSGLRSLDVGWTAPADHGHPITGYALDVYAGAEQAFVKHVEVAGTSTTVTGLISERQYRFAVAATSSAGTGPVSPRSLAATAGNPDLGPHGSLAAFVDQAFTDLQGRPPTPNERAGAIASLANGSVTPGDVLAAQRRSTDAVASVDPVARLYRATFLRIPDRSGLDYWVTKKRNGIKLTTIAENFARSSEFKRRYGSLTDRAYVERLYLNVLGRAGDQGGVDYWTAKLVKRTKTRGQVLASMSESNEYKRTQTSEVDVSVLYVALLRRAPSTSEFDAAVADLDGGGTLADLATDLLLSPAYAARF